MTKTYPDETMNNKPELLCLITVLILGYSIGKENLEAFFNNIHPYIERLLISPLLRDNIENIQSIYFDRDGFIKLTQEALTKEPATIYLSPNVCPVEQEDTNTCGLFSQGQDHCELFCY